MLQVLEAIQLKSRINLLPVREQESLEDRENLRQNMLILDGTLRAIIQEQYAEGKRDFRSQDWSQQDLSGLDLTGCDLRGVNLFGASLRGTNLSQVDLQGANCNRVNFRYSLLEQVICTGVVFNNCLFERAKISKGNWVGATVLSGRFFRTLWHSNKVGTDRFSPNGITLMGLMDEQEIEEFCKKMELKRRKLVFLIFFVIVCVFLQLSSIFVQ